MSEIYKMNQVHEDKLSDHNAIEYNDETIEKTGKFLVTCDEQGSLFAHPIWRVYDANIKLVNLYMAPKSFNDTIDFPLDCDRKKYLLEKYDIKYETFYNYAKKAGNDIYKELINEDAVIKFLIGDDNEYIEKYI